MPLWIQRRLAQRLSTAFNQPVSIPVSATGLRGKWGQHGLEKAHQACLSSCLCIICSLCLGWSLLCFCPDASYTSFNIQPDGHPSLKTSGFPGLFEAASPVTHSTCNISLFSAYLSGYKVSPALPAHHWALGQEPVLLTSWSQTVSLACGYECGLCNQRPTPLHNARSPWHYCLTPLCVPWVPHLKTGPKIVPLQSTAAKV